MTTTKDGKPFATEVVSILPLVPFTEIKQQKKAFDEIIDVRTPLEFAEDHIEGAINLPVLSNEQRAQVGTQYSNDKLAGRKIGAALIARNISDHILNHFQDKDLEYRPLIYCWRGGQRSRSMATILKEIGFHPTLLQGGYKSYRKHICTHLCSEDFVADSQLDKLKFIRVSGVTGSGKTLLLKALEARGEQILDLEDLAKHKGSILGDYPDESQPSQKYFETKLYNKIETLSSDRVVWLENEGSKIGNIGVSRRVWEKMCQSPRIHIKVALEDRVDYILKDYQYFIERKKAELPSLFQRLEKYAGKKSCAAWTKLHEEGEYRKLVESLIGYYDASYKVPSGPSLSDYNIPSGLLLEPALLAESDLVNSIIALGLDYHNNHQEAPVAPQPSNGSTADNCGGVSQNDANKSADLSNGGHPSLVESENAPSEKSEKSAKSLRKSLNETPTSEALGVIKQL